MYSQVGPVPEPGKPRPLSARALRLLSYINAYFVLCGALFVFFGAWGGSGLYARMYEAGTGGESLGGRAIAFGVVVILTAGLGQEGARRDNKCMMLLYFLLLLVTLCMTVAMGITAIVNSEDVNEHFSDWWNDFDDDLKADVQDEYDCCGYHDPEDPDGGVCEITEEDEEWQIVDGVCVDRPPESLCPSDWEAEDGGCSQAGVDHLESRAIPAFFAITITGFAILVGAYLSSRIVCKRTRTVKAPRNVARMNQYM